MPGTSGPDPISTKQQRIAELSQRYRTVSTLAHHIDLDWMREAYRRTRKDGAVGVDRQSAQGFAQNLDANLTELLEALKSGNYRAPPVRRVEIPKGGGKTRALGIPTFADKVLQQAVKMALEPVYETSFEDFSYGFRPGRSAHQALERLQNRLWRMQGSWVIDADIRSYFDTIDHRHLQAMLRERVTDGVLVRAVGKWLNAGVMNRGVYERSERGTPQGGVISPLLANIYLHEMLDTWWSEVVLPRLRGPAELIRYADDLVLVFARRDDAERVLAVLHKRFARYGLSLHPEKTRLLYFAPPRPGGEKRGTFDFLGFTHYWERSRKGHWIPKRKTAKDRRTRTLRAFNEWLRRRRHWSIPEQARALNRSLRGHYAYYGITGNSRCLRQVYRQVQRLWHKWLSRRSQRAVLRWDQFNELLRRHPLARPIAIHSTAPASAKPCR